MSEKIRVLQDFLALLDDVKGPSASGNYVARCPAHDDGTPSLTVCAKASPKDGKQRVYFHCQTKRCSREQILNALGLTARDLILDEGYTRIDRLPNGAKVHTVGKKPQAPKAAGDGLGKLTNTYDYTDSDGTVLFQVCRFEKLDADGKKVKTFRQRQYRPDAPEARNGYVWSVPNEVRIRTLYHLPEVSSAIRNGTPVFVVEGEKDADTMARLGYVATTNPGGAGKWQDGHTTLLRGGDIVVLYDCDVEKNNYTGQKHAWDVATRLKDCALRVRMPALTDACPDMPPKGDITDFFEIMGEEAGKKAFDALVAECADFDPQAVPPWLDPMEAAAAMYDKVGGYCVQDGCICQRTNDGDRKLCTFVALPSQIVTRDDGVNLEKVFVIDGWAQGGQQLPQVQVKAPRFKGMDWVLESWDFAANIMPGNLIKDKLRYAITEVGRMSAKRRTVYTHTGWRKIGGQWTYLHQGGAVGTEGVSVDLESSLANYTLNGCDDLEPGEAARQSLMVRKCISDRLAVPLLGVMFLAPLCEFMRQASYSPGFALFILGGTGCRKSTAIGLTLSYFGAFHAKNLPASFDDTSNTIRKKAFILKDCPIVVDDYHPETSLQERRRMESIAQSLSRAFGDGTDRGRLKADLSLREAMPPRGVAVMSGEDMPNIGDSGTARFYVVNVGQQDVPITEELTEAQEMARRGVLRRVMRGYIEFLQPRADRLSKQLETRWLKLRAQAIKETQGAHKRAPEALAHIMLGYSMMQDYLVSVGAMTDEEANADFLDAWRVLVENSTEQGKEAREERPSKRFISAISELLVNQTVTVKDLSIHSATVEKGMIGYVDADYYYLLPEMSYTTVSRLYSDQGMTFPLSKRLLFRQLRDDGIIVPDADGKTTKSKSVGGKIVRLLWIPRRFLDGDTPAPEEQLRMDGYVQVSDEDMPF